MYWAVYVDKQFSQFSHNGRCCNIQNLNTNVYKQLENWNYWTVKLFQHCCSSKLKLWILRRRIVSEITELSGIDPFHQFVQESEGMALVTNVRKFKPWTCFEQRWFCTGTTQKLLNSEALLHNFINSGYLNQRYN